MSVPQLLQTLYTDRKHSYHLSLFSQLCDLPSMTVCDIHFSLISRDPETQCSQPWDAAFQVVVDSAFWILVEWSGINAFSYTGYIGLSFLETAEENPWYISSLHLVILPLPHPTAIAAPFSLTPSTLPPALGSSTASPSAHMTPTLWLLSMHP